MVIGNDLLDARPLDAAVYAKRSTNCMVLDNVMDDTLVYTNGFDNPATFTGTVYYVAITNGRLISTSASVANANYRFKLAETPLTSDPSITEIRWQAVLKTPTNSEWIAVGFHGGDAALLSAGANSGPWVLFRSTSVTIQGGHSTTGSANTFGSLFTAGQVIHAEFAYHKPSKTADLYINGSPVAVGLPITHKNESGVVADPVIGYAQLMFRLQAPDGAYVDSFKAETLPVEIY
jgi:hypothetical protein